MNFDELKNLYKSGFTTDSDAFVKYFFDEYIDKKNIILHSESGKIVSAGYIIEKPAQIFGKQTIFPYLTALSTLPHLRGKGKIKSIIKSAYQILLDRGYAYFGLMPFNHEFYKRFSLNNISFAAKKIIKGGTDYLSRKITSSDSDFIINLHNQSVAKFNSHLLLTPQVFLQKLREYNLDKAEGIILCDKKTNEDCAFAFYSADEVLFYAAQGNIDINKIQNLKGMNYYDYFDNSSPYLQGRIINAKKALLDYPYSKNLTKSISFRLFDADIPQNNFTANLDITSGLPSLTMADKYEYDFDISYLTQIMFCGGIVFNHCKNYFPDQY